MIEFVYSVRKLKDGKEYASSSLCNAINCLVMYLLDNSLNINKYNLASKQEFRDLWKTLDSKMKQLKKIGKCCLLFAPQSGEHGEMCVSQFVFTSNGGLQFTKFSQKNDQGGIDGNLDSLTIPVPPDPEGLLGLIHDIKLYIEHRPTNFTCDYLHLKINKHSKTIVKNEWYLDSKLGIKTCGNFMKSICNAASVPIITSIAITRHKSESSFRIYSRPSDKQKEDALAFLIESARKLLSNKKNSKKLHLSQKKILTEASSPL
ncbi:15430_t:CDS:2, partial [Racocetra persica]